MGKVTRAIRARVEKELDKITVPHSPREVLIDPRILANVVEGYGDKYEHYLTADPQMVMERWDQLERLRHIAARKLSGRMREVILLLLAGGYSQRKIATILGISRQTVQNHVRYAEKILKEHVAPRGEVHFPAPKGSRYRAAIFPVDTGQEREKFQIFLNRHTVHWVAYGGSGDFREVLVVYA